MLLHLIAIFLVLSKNFVSGFIVPIPRLPRINILLSNDDGWAEANIRALYTALNRRGHHAIISAPAVDLSGTGSLDVPARPLLVEGEYGTIPVGAPAEGFEENDPRINYVNSFPVTSVKYGLSSLSTKFFGGPPDIVLTGPNVGNNLGITTQLSGTMGAAAEAVKQGIPAIAFSGATGPHRPYTELTVGDHSSVYAQVAVRLAQALIVSGKPYLPPGVRQNVNFPASNATTCSSPYQFRFVLSRIYNNRFATDVSLCGSTHLPAESDVIRPRDPAQDHGCLASISTFSGSTKIDAGREAQAFVLRKLGPMLTCP
ncbi:hypothetical protein BOTBODRAFT_133478 [Botryobasidium botryosum FD-172 SS1]|uniref:Survival protein SurE-like phosphatase/nucleotidase domain-containing protein n=1 Tax=Botryobasidium botryosum (strain FD-172 SS1) TaxID=930990 RepID=A0A067MPP3_BOTB1|nr:hypothetical protein BOTBODRAFT_133478 [Botryobasidium botryosum FD-172 SS1]